ncbi:DUF4345 domain-containing protein [Solemya velum gill symbiont]|uniref:DUF4345 domain-containing protein n=1 Tax=Solemya velum gill symbiont TaxID=2340 RepID=UPI000996FB90|nr:DUF4345 domain-containing protein [Solemya velum gill symbiont]OOY56273.1 hypothetical protein BOW00_08090 [Solemya velum gill symbiont]OOY56610.1 hypothetical protein BOV99_04520 [Solemya velum gill symbiont]OOY70158.1 hypothetical protein BOW07_05800 [Solemya velum gill symbiont]OOY80191.1 hypothetical protein BOW11_04940 [Solemya velum gill symbiont]OOY94679.1 hypothetical protein BOW17_04915 [Solemya velum gill symbiont]
MKNSKVLKSILILSGLLASGIGVAILFAPQAFYATNGIELGGNISLLNEIRAPGGALLASGILIISGAFAEKLRLTAVVVSTLLYLSYGLPRVISIAIDGIPAEGLVQAAILEIIIGLTCVFALVKYLGKQKELA